MPKGELEIHPYLELGKTEGAKRLILGSFPVYECTDPDNDLKQKNRALEKTFRFFYGSNRNSFWKRYAIGVDNSLQASINADNILESLKRNGIAVSDTIKSCERVNYSSSDNDLKNKTWNREVIKNLIDNGVEKILCTSKGVLRDLEKNIICAKGDAFGKIIADQEVQNNFIKKLNGNNDLIKHGIAKTFVVGDKKVIAIALPSPGSPQRQIHQFGFHSGKSLDYANQYFDAAFKWLME